MIPSPDVVKSVQPTDEPGCSFGMSRDHDLTAALARNLDAAFPIFVRRFQSEIFTLVRRAGADRATAEDITAEALLRAYRALRGYRADRIRALRPGPWVVTIALNTWRNEMRRRARRPEAPLVAAAGIPGPGPDPEAAASMAADTEWLASALAGLPEPQRLAVVLRHVLDMKYRDIAESLSRPEGTVKSDVARGLAALRRVRPMSVEVTP